MSVLVWTVCIRKYLLYPPLCTNYVTHTPNLVDRSLVRYLRFKCMVVCSLSSLGVFVSPVVEVQADRGPVPAGFDGLPAKRFFTPQCCPPSQASSLTLNSTPYVQTTLTPPLCAQVGPPGALPSHSCSGVGTTRGRLSVS